MHSCVKNSISSLAFKTNKGRILNENRKLVSFVGFWVSPAPLQPMLFLDTAENFVELTNSDYKNKLIAVN